MTCNRRELLLAAAVPTIAAGLPASAKNPDGGDPPIPGPRARRDFPVASEVTYLDSAAQHPLGLPVRRALDRHLDTETYGPGEDRSYFSRSDQIALKEEFGELIGADGDEIAFVQSTSDGENLVISGIGLPEAGGNVVVDDLHFTSSLYLYKMLEEQGVELRVVRSQGGKVTTDALAAAIDENTRIVSLALVSNINGFQHDVAAAAEVAHRHGALLYADIIQAAGAVPLDMKGMGIDCAAASTYKWLMADRGFGLLYVRRDLQQDRVPTTRWGHRHVTSFDRSGDFSWKDRPGGSPYETGNISEPLAAMTLGGVRYIQSIGVDNIVEHAQGLIGRLRSELGAAGYRCLTPEGTRTPILAFHLDDPEKVADRLRAERIWATVARADRRLRLSVSVFNTDEDVDRVVSALT
ncbi:MAG: aminotransferase class V-fold PLP-dependent enzyme [Acidobacteriota bacterium]